MAEETDSKKNNGLYEERRVYGTKKQMEQRNAVPGDKPKKQPRDNGHRNIIVILCMTVFMLAITIGIAGLFKKPENVKPAEGKITGTPTPEPETREIYGVVLGVDTENKVISIYDVKNESNTEFKYDGASRFYGSAGSIVTAGVLQTGDLLHFTSREGKPEKLAVAKWSENIWEKSKIEDLVIYPEEHVMVIRNQNYKYSDDLCIIDNGERTGLDNLLTTADRYTIRGEGTTVYEIIVTIGHGTLKLLNYKDYDGGLVTIGDRYAFDVTAPAEYVVREGTYRVEVGRGRLNAFQNIEVRRNRTVFFDLKPAENKETQQ